MALMLNGLVSVKLSGITEIRFHGRGGQGVVTAAQLFVEAVVAEGKWAQAIPLFGAERRGAPVVSFVRIADQSIPLHSPVKNPDIVVVLDPFVITVVDVLQGLRENGVVVINSSEPPRQLMARRSDVKVFYVDATGIALRLGLVVAGWPVVNTAMLGALVKASKLVSIDGLARIVEMRWGGKMGKLNAEAVKLAYDATRSASP